uniref:ShKT domain-containing protein n=2 Tax=Bursaphelenchus xylophilus TaxID=6326 RepID=A0A1I7SC06_BURXY
MAHADMLETCRDKSSDCDKELDFCEDRIRADVLKVMCAETCGYCESHHCQQYDSLCEHELVGEFMQRRCKDTCDFKLNHMFEEEEERRPILTEQKTQHDDKKKPVKLEFERLQETLKANNYSAPAPNSTYSTLPPPPTYPLPYSQIPPQSSYARPPGCVSAGCDYPVYNSYALPNPCTDLWPSFHSQLCTDPGLTKLSVCTNNVCEDDATKECIKNPTDDVTFCCVDDDKEEAIITTEPSTASTLPSKKCPDGSVPPLPCENSVCPLGDKYVCQLIESSIFCCPYQKPDFNFKTTTISTSTLMTTTTSQSHICKDGTEAGAACENGECSLGDAYTCELIGKQTYCCPYKATTLPVSTTVTVSFPEKLCKSGSSSPEACNNHVCALGDGYICEIVDGENRCCPYVPPQFEWKSTTISTVKTTPAEKVCKDGTTSPQDNNSKYKQYRNIINHYFVSDNIDNNILNQYGNDFHDRVNNNSSQSNSAYNYWNVNHNYNDNHITDNERAHLHVLYQYNNHNTHHNSVHFIDSFYRD